MRVHILQHVEFEGPGVIEPWARGQGHNVTIAHLYRGDPLPAPEAVDWLIVMGGPMGANDDARYPWMTPEKGLVAKAMAAGKPVLGVCLGAQIIAAVAGARVYANREREIGWWPIELTRDAAASALRDQPARFEVLHWHGDTFDLPAGARHLARSAGCENQAFAIGSRVLGLQFHLDLLPEGVARLISECPADLRPGPFVQPPAAIVAAEKFAALHARMFALLDRMQDDARGV